MDDLLVDVPGDLCGNFVCLLYFHFTDSCLCTQKERRNESLASYQQSWAGRLTGNIQQPYTIIVLYVASLPLRGRLVKQGIKASFGLCVGFVWLDLMPCLYRDCWL